MGSIKALIHAVQVGIHAVQVGFHCCNAVVPLWEASGPISDQWPASKLSVLCWECANLGNHLKFKETQPAIVGSTKSVLDGLQLYGLVGCQQSF